MSAILTADQFRFIWRLAGGDAILMPIQAPSRGRMASDRDRIEIELAAWWAANPEPGLYEAVRDLRQSPAWLHLQGFPAVGKPIRALLGVGGGGRSVLAVQDATAAVRDEDGENRDWYPDTAGTSSGWSLERGGDVRLSVGHAETLVARMAAVVGELVGSQRFTPSRQLRERRRRHGWPARLAGGRAQRSCAASGVDLIRACSTVFRPQLEAQDNPGHLQRPAAARFRASRLVGRARRWRRKPSSSLI